MSAPRPEQTEGTPPEHGAPPASDGDGARADEGAAWQQLRTLLLGPERQSLHDMRQRLTALQERDQRLENVSDVLPDAFARRAQEDERLAQALGPTIEESLRRSIERDPEMVADVLYPVMAPAIRKSLREALSALLVAVNQTLEYSLSPRSIRWRFEAWRTGSSFASIVLRHTLRYRVEQILLIDADTGLLLHHVVAEAVTVQDSNLVSGMLTAIQDFAKDSFGAGDEETLDAFQVGELTVWVVPGPEALVAAVVRGLPDPSLRERLHLINEEVHSRFGHELRGFEGAVDVFAQSAPMLEAGLVTEYHEDETPSRTSPVLWIVLVVLLLGAGTWAFTAWREYRQWNRYVALLEAEPGLVVVDTDTRRGKWLLRGLRDPLARDPAVLLAGSGLTTGEVVARWEPFQALDSALVVRRAVRLLQPPEGVVLHLDGEQLFATGTAPASWIRTATDRVRFLAGVNAFDMSALVDASEQALRARIRRLEQQGLRFLGGTDRLAPDQDEVLGEVLATVQAVLDAAADTGVPVRIQVRGHASRDGSEALNRRLRQQRAEMIRDMMVARGLPAEALEAVGVAELRSEADAGDEATREANRSISFHVVREDETAR